MDTSKLQAFLTDPLLEHLENYSTWVVTSHNDGTAKKTLLLDTLSIQTGTSKK